MPGHPSFGSGRELQDTHLRKVGVLASAIFSLRKLGVLASTKKSGCPGFHYFRARRTKHLAVTKKPGRTPSARLEGSIMGQMPIQWVGEKRLTGLRRCLTTSN